MDNYPAPNPFASFFTPTFISIMLVFAIIEIVAYWRIFTKAGQPGWACLIPIYNAYILTVIIGKPWWWLLLMIFPCTSFIFAIWATNLLSKSFGQGVGIYSWTYIFIIYILPNTGPSAILLI